MSRLPIWCAVSASAFLAMSAPLFAASLDKGTNAWAVPNLFGTVALPVTRTPYDAKWRHAGFGSPGPFSTLDKNGAPPSLQALAMVHRDVNRRVTYRADSSRLNAGDTWSTAANTLARGSGDCEDYAIAKGKALLALGFPPQDLYLVIGNYLTLRSAHAILVVRVGARFYVLDNLSGQVVDAEQFRSFSPVMTLSANRKWLHGYERGARPHPVNAPPPSLDLPTERIWAIKVAQFATPTARSPVR